MKARERSPMQWVFELEFATPAFIGGAHPNGGAGLRIPSLRGALRDWYRVLVGGVAAAGVLPMNEWPDHLTEARLFGGTGTGYGQGRMVLSLTAAPEPPKLKPASRVLNGRGGLKYLGYSFTLGKNNRVAISEGYRFKLRAVFPRGLLEDEERLLAATWWLLCHFGGLGSRSRRGWGAVQPVSWPPESHGGTSTVWESLPSILDANRPQGAAKSVSDVLRQQMAWLTKLRPEHDRGLHPIPSYRLIEGDSRAVVWAGPDGLGWKDALGALDAAGKEMMTFRREHGRDGFDFSTLDALLSGERLPHAPYRSAFGLPLRYFDRWTRRGATLVPDVGSRRKRAMRAASPLVFRPFRVAAGRFFVLFLRLGGSLPGRDVGVRRQRRFGSFSAFGREAKLILDEFIGLLPGEGMVEP